MGDFTCDDKTEGQVSAAFRRRLWRNANHVDASLAGEIPPTEPILRVIFNVGFAG